MTHIVVKYKLKKGIDDIRITFLDPPFLKGYHVNFHKPSNCFKKNIKAIIKDIVMDRISSSMLIQNIDQKEKTGE